ncbi:MAG: Hsp20/alpha crystallin family protein [Thermodesulfobacteriota bacterium]
MHHDKDEKTMTARAKSEAQVPAEQTRPGRVFTPDVDIYEKDNEIVILADLPGVAAQDLTIDLKDSVLTITGDVSEPAENEQEVVREYLTGRYFRQFTLSEVIDQAKIEAKLADGVMRLTLPKVSAAQPRKIEVKPA